MLRNVNNLRGYAIRATDGVIGKVDDFYFDDQRSTAYLVSPAASAAAALPSRSASAPQTNRPAARPARSAVLPSRSHVDMCCHPSGRSDCVDDGAVPTR